MKLNILWGLGVLLTIVLINACSDPTLIGAGLLDNDRAEVGFTDTFELKGATERTESLLAYSPFAALQADRFLFGDFQDPVFGGAKSTINMQFIPGTIPEFTDMMGVDSVVLLLPYTSGGFYGKTEGETFGMRVTELTEILNEDLEYFSNREVSIATAPLTEYEFTATLDSVEYVDYIALDADTLSLSHLRVPLPIAFGDSLVSFFQTDSASFVDIDLFLNRFPGFQLEPSVESEGMLAFTLLSVRAGIHVYYRDSSNAPRKHQYIFNNSQVVQYATFEHDYEGTEALEFIENGSENDSLLYVQGMAGLRSKIKLPDLALLNNVAINQAYLDIYVARGESLDTSIYPLARQLVLRAENDAGEEEFIEDAALVDARQLPYDRFFGGQPEFIESEGAIRYRMSVSNYIQQVIEGRMADEFYIVPIENNDLTDAKRGEIAERVILYGGEHPQYPIKLSVTFTQL
jgi:hypothetical protein